MSETTQLVQTGPISRWVARSYRALSKRAVNYEPITWDEAAVDPRWHVDHQSVILATEKPGPPQPQGPYAIARQMLHNYEVADPLMVRALYDASRPLEGRDMLLVGRLCGMRFPMGVRVGGVFDGVDLLEGEPVERFSWYYRTLEGHIERGQMNYEVVKYLNDGRVEFRMAAYSRRGPIANPVTFLGFLMFGRALQLRFYTRAVERMTRLTAAPATKN